MSHSRLIAIEVELKAGTSSEFRVAMRHPGFQPTGYRVVSVIHNLDNVDLGPLVISHDQLGVLAVFDEGTGITPVSARIDNTAELNLHSGATSTITITQRGSLKTNLEGNLAILLECTRKAPPAEHKSK